MNKKLVFVTALLVSSQLLAANDVSQRRLFMLEQAIAPQGQLMVAHTWAEAAKHRNGAVQYMLLCPNLQKANFDKLETMNWVTGVSSPTIATYRVIPALGKNRQMGFTIHYNLALQGKMVGTVTDQLQIQKADKDSSQQWCISEFKFLSPSSQPPQR